MRFIESIERYMINFNPYGLNRKQINHNYAIGIMEYRDTARVSTTSVLYRRTRDNRWGLSNMNSAILAVSMNGTAKLYPARAYNLSERLHRPFRDLLTEYFDININFNDFWTYSDDDSITIRRKVHSEVVRSSGRSILSIGAVHV